MQSVLIKPIISEKTLRLASTENQYVFAVVPKANKIEIAKEVTSRFNVGVLKVRMLNELGKQVQFGRKRISGRKQNTKKAIVTLKKGDKIAEFDMN